MLRKAALKAEAAELKKNEKEKQKWEKGKFALKSIVAEIDSKVVESGSIGGMISILIHDAWTFHKGPMSLFDRCWTFFV